MNQISYRYCHFPPTIVQRAVYLYTRYSLSLRTARHHQSKWRNNRIESSHVPIRIRERKMQRFRSIGSTQRFLSVHAAVYNTFNTRRHLITASEHRKRRNNAFRQWREVVAVGA